MTSFELHQMPCRRCHVGVGRPILPSSKHRRPSSQQPVSSQPQHPIMSVLPVTDPPTLAPFASARALASARFMANVPMNTMSLPSRSEHDEYAVFLAAAFFGFGRKGKFNDKRLHSYGSGLSLLLACFGLWCRFFQARIILTAAARF